MFFIATSPEKEWPFVGSFLKSDDLFKKLIQQFKIETDLYDVAIRSSAINEDSTEKSFAGHFQSYVEPVSMRKLILNIENVIKSIQKFDDGDTQSIGVVVQKRINAKYSGIAFSSNPITASKQEVLISLVEGMGDKLVSGKISGVDFIVNFNSDKPEYPS
ncbi:MAG: hypothetical protein IPH20_14290 [Bacteroidales bacterium]|nr:hypothetical protein [Bacteroidales bacterium]